MFGGFLNLARKLGTDCRQLRFADALGGPAGVFQHADQDEQVLLHGLVDALLLVGLEDEVADVAELEAVAVESGRHDVAHAVLDRADQFGL